MMRIRPRAQNSSLAAAASRGPSRNPGFAHLEPALPVYAFHPDMTHFTSSELFFPVSSRPSRRVLCAVSNPADAAMLCSLLPSKLHLTRIIYQ